MSRSITAYWNRSLSYVSRIRFARALPLVALLAGVSAALATPVPSRVSCGSSSFSTAGTDACSVYLSAKASSRVYVTLTSNNPAVTVPGGVTVKGNAATTGFKATVNAVATPQTATITAKAGGVSTSFSITLTPAQGNAALSVNASSIGFGSVAVNTPVSQPLTLTSTGTAPVTVNSASLSGSGFSISGATFPVALNPGQSLTLEVQFDPAAAGTYSGQLTIASSASIAAVALSGNGIAPQVQLTWSSPAGSSDPIAGYHVYRSPSGTGSYQLVNSSIDSQTAYADTTVQGGSAYDYYVTTVDTQGVESIPSNVTSVTVP